MRAKQGPVLIGRRILAGLLAAALLLGACSSGTQPASQMGGTLPTRTLVPPTTTPIPPTLPVTPTPTDLPGAAALRPTGTATTAAPSAAQAIVALTLADLLAAQDIAPAEVRLISLETFTWSDDTWNCSTRAADQTPAPAQVPGFRVVFATGRGAVVYHTDQQGEFFVCQDRAWLAQLGEPVLQDPIAAAMVALSQQDAARRLGLESDTIRPVNVLTLTWPDASLGCPKAGIDYDARETPGYRIVLQADTTQLIYHASARETVLCTPDEEILPGIVRDALP